MKTPIFFYSFIRSNGTFPQSPKYAREYREETSVAGEENYVAWRSGVLVGGKLSLGRQLGTRGGKVGIEFEACVG